MKKNSSHKTLSIVKRISITNIGIFIIACILSIVATLKLNVEYHIDRDAQMMKVYISNTLSSIDNTLKDMGIGITFYLWFKTASFGYNAVPILWMCCRSILPEPVLTDCKSSWRIPVPADISLLDL